MIGDSEIWRACMRGHPDWWELSGICGLPVEGVMERAQHLGAWWLLELEPAAIARGDKAVRAGLAPGLVAEAMGGDVHQALILIGLRSVYGNGGAG